MEGAGKKTAKTVVVKIGSSTLTDERGKFRLGPMAGRVAEICGLRRQGHRVVLVSSGAVSSGMGLLRLAARPTEVVDLQAAAAVGQGHLYHTYSQLFAHEEVITAQVLLTAFDISARTQYLNARNTLRRLLEWGVVPIVNENDTTSTDELCFGDNDALAAQVALLVKANLLLLLTDTEGLYTANPREDPSATLIREVRDFSEIASVDTETKGALGLGGMRSKVGAARIRRAGGVETVIARGSRPGVIAAVLAGEPVGTRFAPRDLGLGAFKQWLLYGKPSRGRVVVDAGAERALHQNRSLLPVGILRVEGDFDAGDAVTVVNESGVELAKGVSNYASDELDLVKGLRSNRISERLPLASPEAIHRDYLVLVE
ncbi:MAG: glutamate 5-kinase [Actinobacteria bacterium]|nr:glutamate 5-kinase [Actinomycetota bacterium]